MAISNSEALAPFFKAPKMNFLFSLASCAGMICMNQYSVDNANGDLFIVALIIKFC